MTLRLIKSIVIFILLFFKNENHTSIIWYGSSFDDLPMFIKKLTDKINEETGLSPQNREWQLLLNPISTEDEVSML